MESANRLMIAGLGFLTLALSGSVLLITDMMFDGVRVWLYTGLVALCIAGMWFLRPLARKVEP